MPTFSFRKRTNNQQLGRDDSDVQLGSDAPEKVRWRQSKREYFRSLLKMSSESRTNHRLVNSHSPQPSSKTPEPTSPMDKPLPPPPPPDSEPERPVKAPIKLERIMSPIALVDLQKLFSGAPQFFARSEGHHTGAPHPSVAFPWNTDLEIRDLSDHIQISDEAWRCVTAWPHITVQASRNPEASDEHHKKCKARYLPRCRERPNMLSAQGIERGTMGYQAALDMGVADAMEIPGEHVHTTPELISEQRRMFLNGKDGLRPMTDSTLIERLIDVGEVYHQDHLKHGRSSVELYTELFTQILFPPSRVTDSHDPYSLQVQIEALIDVLAAPLVWVDFTLIEWRIRLGQILWGGATGPDTDDRTAFNNEIFHEPGTQKYWLLLQVLLSCELLIRLDAISSNIDRGVELPKPSDMHKFDKTATTSVRWSLLLARAWLENIRLENPDPKVAPEVKTAGWLATLTGTTQSAVVTKDLLSDIRLHGRHQTRQLSGLLHFARKLDWPGLEELTAKVSSNGINIADIVQSSPTGTPLSIATNPSSSYFSNKRPKVRRGLSTHKNVSALIHPAGWLSNSYISGLILPGEGLSHFLISTLLENDISAISQLGEEANLYGGFIYAGKSFWSTACIVGRVLAARRGASECMGWISSDVTPQNIREGWVDIDIDTDILDDPNKRAPKPRLCQKTSIERDGNVIGGADISSVLPGDFVLPSDESLQQPFLITIESLDLYALVDSMNTTPINEQPTPQTESSDAPAIRTYLAAMRFTVELPGEDKKEINISLSHDVHFVTAYPCITSPHTEILKSPMSPSFQALEQRSSSITSTDPPQGHPLHKAFTYTKIPLSYLLATSSLTPFTSLLSPPVSASVSQNPFPSPSTSMFNQIQSSTHTTSSSIPKVLVIDCTDSTISSPAFPHRPLPSPHSPHPRTRAFGSDLEVLARAVCAERGWNALISRRGRGCLACAIREAGALGWRVVLRVA